MPDITIMRRVVRANGVSHTSIGVTVFWVLPLTSFSRSDSSRRKMDWKYVVTCHTWMVQCLLVMWTPKNPVAVSNWWISNYIFWYGCFEASNRLLIATSMRTRNVFHRFVLLGGSRYVHRLLEEFVHVALHYTAPPLNNVELFKRAMSIIANHVRQLL